MDASSTAPVGWYLIGFLESVPPGVSPLQIGSHALLAVRSDDTVEIFDGRCPHRGAHLGHGGVLDRGCVVCPFHGKHIQLGAPEKRLGVAGYPVLQAGDAVFVRLGPPGVDHGFPATAARLAGYQIRAAVELEVAIPAPYIVENAFDIDHFTSVHKVPRVRGLQVEVGPAGELTVATEFVTAAAPWEKQAARLKAAEAVADGGPTAPERAALDGRNQFLARAYSPNLVVTDFDDGTRHSFIITGAVPLGPRRTLARVLVAAEPGCPAAVLDGMAGGARKALAEDALVWAHLDTDGPERFDARDTAVLAFRTFCSGFPDAGAPEKAATAAATGGRAVATAVPA